MTKMPNRLKGLVKVKAADLVLRCHVVPTMYNNGRVRFFYQLKAPMVENGCKRFEGPRKPVSQLLLEPNHTGK